MVTYLIVVILALNTLLLLQTLQKASDGRFDNLKKSFKAFFDDESIQSSARSPFETFFLEDYCTHGRNHLGARWVS